MAKKESARGKRHRVWRSARSGNFYHRLRPVQIIFAGKAHPSDIAGAQLIQRVFHLAQDPSFGARVAFVENYDQHLAARMVRGVDVWLNNPLPPLEASGTSGMKAGANGVPSLSVLDGWWLEGYNGKNGWAFGGEPVEGERTNADARLSIACSRKKSFLFTITV